MALAAEIALWPRWLQELTRSLAVRSQVVLSGNIRDVFLLKSADGDELGPLIECIWRALATQGYEALIRYRPIDGIDVYPPLTSSREDLLRFLKLTGEDTDGRNGDKCNRVSLSRLPDLLRRVSLATDHRLAFVIDYASRLARSAIHLEPDEHEFFVACEQLSNLAEAIKPRPSDRDYLFNVIIWLVERDNDLPPWFTSAKDRIRSYSIPHPDFDARHTVARAVARKLSGYADCDEPRRDSLCKAFADQTDGLPLSSMNAILQLARRESVPFVDIEEAVLRYKLGVTDNPWRQKHLRLRVSEAEAHITTDRVKGQPAAVSKTLDILKRSIGGLTGAHVSRRSGRPRGILFFAGPTGVGKTELAKAITERLFGDERAYVRFDMSEFSAEHSDARLLGAPPGYVGYDSGGQLTNAVRQRPFSVLLFDEIEKAHPRVLDKFLQILEDGRVTDGAGNTVYFSEAVIIFTSNLGIMVRDSAGGWREHVQPGTPYQQLERSVRQAIENHFKTELRRPELLNRIGDNIVVFNFIERGVGEEIFEMMLKNVTRRVGEEYKAALTLTDHAHAKLREWCVSDLSLGGRGIGNTLEARFVNPLARHLFDASPREGAALVVSDIEEVGGVYTVVASCESDLTEPTTL